MKRILAVTNAITPVEDGDASLRLIACPSLFSIEHGRIDVNRPAGGTVADLLRSIGWMPGTMHALVEIDGVLVREAQWEYLKPLPHQCVQVHAIPTGPGGQGKDATRLVAMIAVIGAAIAAPYALGALGVAGMTTLVGTSTVLTPLGAFTAAATSIALTYGVNVLIPPSRTNLDELSGLPTSSHALALTGTSNQLLPYGIVPRVYGRHRIFPPKAARPFTEVIGSQQYLREVFCLGYGPLAISDIRIGETPIENFADIQLEIRQGYATDPQLTLYPQAVREEALGILITNASGGVIRTTQNNVSELSVDVTFPEGAWKLSFDGNNIGPVDTDVTVLVEYRPTGTAPWKSATGRAEVKASLTTAFTGTNNDLVFTAGPDAPGDKGNNVTVSFIDAGPRASETVEALPMGPGAWHLKVWLRNVGGVYSTASQIVAFLSTAQVVYRSAPFNQANQLFLRGPVSDWLQVALAPGNDGSGTVLPLAPTHLAGGLSGIPSIAVGGQLTGSVRRSLRWKTETIGQFDVRVSRTSADRSAPYHDQFYWTTLRSFLAGQPVSPRVPMAFIAMRAKQTDQLTGQIDQLNCVASSILPDWTGTQWIEQETANPASIWRDIHQGSANARPKPDTRLDLVAAQGFHERCKALGFEFHTTLDYRGSVEDRTRDALAAGRATPGMLDGKHSIVEDILQTTAVHLLTPRNSWGYRADKVFVELPHGIKARYVNTDTLQQDEMIVLADGYGVTGPDLIRRDAFGQPTTLPEATKFETMDAGVGVTDQKQIFALFRYYLACLVLRSESHSVNMDFEQLRMVRGNLVIVQHDVPLLGLGAGRVKSVLTDGAGRTTGVVLDEACVMQAGDRYGVRVTLRDGTYLQREVVNVPGEHTTFTFVNPI